MRLPETGFVDYGPMPHGYATAADVTSILTLHPGENVLFSDGLARLSPDKPSCQRSTPKLLVCPESGQRSTRGAGLEEEADEDTAKSDCDACVASHVQPDLVFPYVVD